MAEPSELVQALSPLVSELIRLGVRHFVGGSIASSIHGAARSTLDVDVVAEIDEAAGLQLIASLQDDYYISKEAVLEAVQRCGCFNLIHYATSFKVDVFVNKGREFDRSVQDRAVNESIGDVGALSIPVATAEDIILSKLEWYRLGNETSQRQWSDLTLVVKLQGDRLDRDYLNRWATELGVADLLDRLLSQLQEGDD